MRKLDLSKLRYLGIVASLLFDVAWGQGATLKVVDSNHKSLSDAIVLFEDRVAVEVNLSQKNIVDQIKGQFVPRVSVIYEGQLVEFPNKDQVRHHVYSFSPAHTFEIQLYEGAPESPIQFLKTGVVTLGCNIHDQMVGFIYVAQPMERAFVSDENGILTVPEEIDMSQIKSAKLWQESFLKGFEVVDITLNKGVYEMQSSMALKPKVRPSTSSWDDY